METFLMVAILYLIAGLALVGVLAPHLNDTLTQRVGLSCLSIGALGMAEWCKNNDTPWSLGIMFMGIGVFMVATAAKLYRTYHDAQNKRRRITDRLHWSEK